MTLIEFMRNLDLQNLHDEKGFYVLSPSTMKRYRKESNDFKFELLGHKVRSVKGCPNDKVYLMSATDYAKFSSGVLEGILNHKKDSDAI